MDHYLDVPVDLSKVLFICTANTEESIPRALADRIEFIRLSGYIHDEKVQIAQRYLSAEARKRTGITLENVELTDPALDTLIRWYCREAGVRELEKKIEKIYRKAALRLVKDKSLKRIVIDEKVNESEAPVGRSAHLLVRRTSRSSLVNLYSRATACTTMCLKVS